MSQSTDSNPYTKFLIPISIILSGLLISISILYSVNTYVKKGNLVTKENLNSALSEVLYGSQQNTTQQPNQTAKVTIDNEPTEGDKSKVKVALVEYSDYECPFCKKFFDESYGQIKKEYIDTGKILHVYKDYPLSFHEPMASIEAQAAHCVKDQSNDEKYFQYHDLMFKNTTSNGTGLTRQQVDDFAASLGVDLAKFKDCVDKEKFKDDINKDRDEGTRIGIDGTPGFVIGILNSDGTVEGQVMTGAQPYATFKSIIDGELSK